MQESVLNVGVWITYHKIIHMIMMSVYVNQTIEM